jgi:hypothetical protein
VLLGAHRDLAYRQHTAPGLPPPAAHVLVLDTTPPVFGPAEVVLRVAVQLITLLLWGHDAWPAVVTLTRPGLAAPVRTAEDLVRVWASRTLARPELEVALAAAAGTGLPVIVLSTWHLPRDRQLRPGPGLKLLTTHNPGYPPPPAPDRPGHRHLPPDPTPRQLTTALTHLLTP